jgi:hypothetical protein
MGWSLGCGYHVRFNYHDQAASTDSTEVCDMSGDMGR